MAPPRAPIGKFGLIGRFFGNTVSEAAAFAAGVALGPVLGPPVELTKQKVQAAFPFKIPDVGVLAEGLAQGQVDEADARPWAKAHGFDTKAFDALVAIANVGPGMAQAFNLWRRKQTDEAGFRRALHRLGLEQEWIDALWLVREEVLDPAELARAIHRGLIPDPGLLEGRLPSGVGNVPAYPVYPIDALLEAAGSGIDHDRLGVMVGLQGLPMGSHEAAEALFRGILDENDYLRAIAEGNTRNEWADAILDQTRQIPTARDFLENALRGYSTLPEAIDGTAMHGMSADHATLIYQNQGRPMNLHQITQALAWGASFNPEPGEITDPYRASTVEGSIKPGYYELFEALKYNLPSAFYFRILQTTGVLPKAEALTWYLRLGWPPELAEKVATALDPAGGGGGAVDAHVKKAQTSTFTAAHRSYVARESQAGDVAPIMGTLGIDQASQTAILDLWNAERDLIHAELSPTQIRKAVKAAIVNRATGQPWTRADALAALLARGYSQADAETFLDE